MSKRKYNICIFNIYEIYLWEKILWRMSANILREMYQAISRMAVSCVKACQLRNIYSESLYWEKLYINLSSIHYSNQLTEYSNRNQITNSRLMKWNCPSRKLWLKPVAGISSYKQPQLTNDCSAVSTMAYNPSGWSWRDCAVAKCNILSLEENVRRNAAYPYD
jgi:hypothetical protein